MPKHIYSQLPVTPGGTLERSRTTNGETVVQRLETTPGGAHEAYHGRCQSCMIAAEPCVGCKADNSQANRNARKKAKTDDSKGGLAYLAKADEANAARREIYAATVKDETTTAEANKVRREAYAATVKDDATTAEANKVRREAYAATVKDEAATAEANIARREAYAVDPVATAEANTARRETYAADPVARAERNAARRGAYRPLLRVTVKEALRLLEKADNPSKTAIAYNLVAGFRAQGLNLLEGACDQGCAKAHYEMACLLLTGRAGVEVNRGRAFEELERASSKGYADGKIEFSRAHRGLPGRTFTEKFDCPLDGEIARNLLEEVCMDQCDCWDGGKCAHDKDKQAITYAFETLVCANANGEATLNISTQETTLLLPTLFRLYKAGAAKGILSMQIALFHALSQQGHHDTYYESFGEDTLRCLIDGATAGNPILQRELGTYCEHVAMRKREAWHLLSSPRPHGSFSDVLAKYSVALKWYRKAADQGDPGAQYSLALLFASEQSICRGPDGYSIQYLGPRMRRVECVLGYAWKWLYCAAVQGLADAQYAYGNHLLYRVGEYPTRMWAPCELPSAMFWYHKAAEQNHVKAQASLGMIYHAGISVPGNYHFTNERYSSVPGMSQYYYTGYYMKWFLTKDVHVEKNYDKALFWYREAAVQGDRYSQFNMACMYDSGHGVAQSGEDADRWYERATAQGDAETQHARGVIYSKPSNEWLFYSRLLRDPLFEPSADEDAHESLFRRYFNAAPTYRAAIHAHPCLVSSSETAEKEDPRYVTTSAASVDGKPLQALITRYKVENEGRDPTGSGLDYCHSTAQIIIQQLSEQPQGDETGESEVEDDACNEEAGKGAQEGDGGEEDEAGFDDEEESEGECYKEGEEQIFDDDDAYGYENGDEASGAEEDEEKLSSEDDEEKGEDASEAGSEADESDCGDY